MNYPASDLQQRLPLAVQFALAAGDLTLKYFQQQNLQVERKADRSPVTIADREAEMLLRDRIQRHFPQDAIIGEEFGETAGTSGYRWVLDPIDGTKSFISGVPLYGTMIGVECDGRSAVGVVNIAALGECVFAATGQGCYYRRAGLADVRAKVSEKDRLEAGVFLTSQIDSFSVRGASDAFHALERKAYVTRTWGDCYGYMLVATGRADVMIDPIMNVWDAAALQPILEEAGGSFTDWQGRPTIYAGEAVATNGRLLEEVLEITRRYPKPS